MSFYLCFSGVGGQVSERYERHGRRKYMLKMHIVLVTKYRRRLMHDEISETIKSMIGDICRDNKWILYAIETDKDHIHLLIGYDTTDRVCDIVKTIKQETTYWMWQRYPNILSRYYYKKKGFWSDGYFVCSIGEVSSATIQNYIESQG